jgi:hypothetical protein
LKIGAATTAPPSSRIVSVKRASGADMRQFLSTAGSWRAAAKRIGQATLMLSEVHNKWNAKERPNHVL